MAGAIALIALLGSSSSAVASSTHRASAAVAARQAVPVLPVLPFVPSPTFGSLGLALVVYTGGTIDNLEAAAAAAGASGVWVQDSTGTFQLLVVSGPAFLRNAFAGQFPGTALAPSFSRPIAVTLVKASSRTITLADNDSAITMHVGDRFDLMLGDSFTWDVQITDQTVVSRVVNILVVRGSQGVYEARRAGTTDLTATGDPLCRQSSPPCAAPSILFRLHIAVAP